MKDKRIYVAGHNGMVGSAIVRKLQQHGCHSIITRSHQELDLTNQAAVQELFNQEQIDCVILAAAKVGGIHANNSYPADFIYQNLMIEANVIHSAYELNVEKLLFLGSSCIYPKESTQPIKEEYLLTGKLELTNEPYAIAKIAGIKLCESYNRQYNTDYRSVMPTNLYGPGDNYHPDNSHVVPALIHRFHDAKINDRESVVIWGTGKPLREFLHVDDLAEASLHVLNLPRDVYEANTETMLSHINVGRGVDISIKELALLIADVTGYKGDITFDSSKPDGVKRKLMDSSKLKSLNWKPEIKLSEGLKSTYDCYLIQFTQ